MAEGEYTMLYRAPDSTEAALIGHALEVEGIVARLVGGNMEFAWQDLGLEAFQVEIWVPADRAREAKRTIEELQARRREAAAAGPSERSWTCPRCGEACPDDFQLCWSCGAPRTGGQADST